MTFPGIPTAAAGRIISSSRASTSSTLTSPDLGTLTKGANELLISIAFDYGCSLANAWSSWGGGFASFANLGSSGVSPTGIAWKVSDGTETGTFTVTQGGIVGGHAQMIVFSVPGAYTGAAPEFTTYVTGTTSAADPAALSPAAGAEDLLFAAICGSGATASTGTFTGPGTAPTNYGSTFDVGPSSGTPASGVAELAVAFRQINTSSENVGTWGCDVSNARNSAVVIAIRPQPRQVPLGTDRVPLIRASYF